MILIDDEPTRAEMYERLTMEPEVELKNRSFSWALDWLKLVPNARVSRSNWSPFIWLTMLDNAMVLDTGASTRYFHPTQPELLADDWELLK